MLVENESILDYFRRKKCCERCGITCKPSPHHVKPRGMGAGSRLDIAVNLVSVCPSCHLMLQEGGKAAQVECWTIIAAREGLDGWETCRDAVDRLLRTKAVYAARGKR